MDLPKNARVVVVDNVQEEVRDLLAVLAKRGIGTLYYAGASAFPDAPLTGIRLLFLDLELEGLESAGATTKASAAVGNLKKLVAQDNGPLVVVIWTDHQEDAEQVKMALQQGIKVPLFVACVAKSTCRMVDTSGEGIFSLDLIQEQLSAQLSVEELDVFGLYVDWENAVFNGTVQLSARLSNVVDGSGEKWHEVMSRAFYKLYKAECGKNVLSKAQDQFLSSCHLYNSGLVTNLDNALSGKSMSVRDGFRLRDTPLENEAESTLTSRLNAFLFYDSSVHTSVLPGDVYAVRGGVDENVELLKAVLRDFGTSCDMLDTCAHSADISLCKVIITPPCDFAQNKKMKVSEERKFDRYVWALLVRGDERARLSPRGDGAYGCLTNFEFKNEPHDLLVDLYAVGTEVLNTSAMDWLFTLKAIPLADLQSKAANQLNRIGICSVK